VKFNIIYADPPWKYRQGKSMGTNFQGAADAQYSCMRPEDIALLPVSSIADDNCILFLWVTFPMLREGLEVIKAWGFEYKTIAFNWVKLNPIALTPFFGVGYYTKSNAEPCLLATRGQAHKLVINNSQSSIILVPRTKHSTKPNEAKERIDKLVGTIPKVELFAREQTEGWVCLGNDITNTDIGDDIRLIASL